MAKRTDIRKVLIIGSGPIVIGQACEFDYSGTQACKALRACGYQVVLVNSNPATIMTDSAIADTGAVHTRALRTRSGCSCAATTTIVYNQTAVANHNGLQTLVLADFESLQTAAGHTGRRDTLGVNLAVILAVLVGILRENPVNGIGQLARLSAAAATHSAAETALRTLFRHRTDCNDDDSLRCNLIQEIDVT